MNVAFVIVLAFCMPILFSSRAGSETITTFLLFLGFGLAAVGALNYIFFGKLTLWRRD
jgi:hypothetical protein